MVVFGAGCAPAIAKTAASGSKAGMRNNQIRGTGARVSRYFQRKRVFMNRVPWVTASCCDESCIYNDKRGRTKAEILLPITGTFRRLDSHSPTKRPLNS